MAQYDQKHFKEQFEGLPLKAAAIIALRAAMRTLPVLAYRQGSDAEPFAYWRAGETARHALAIIRCYQASVFVNNLTIADKATASAAAAAAARSDAAAAAVSSASTAVARSAADAAYAAYAAAGSNRHHSAAASAAARSVAASAVARSATSAFSAVSNDIARLRQNKVAASENPAYLLAETIWQRGIPVEIQKLWEQLKKDLQRLDVGFEFWIDWYQERLDGKPFNWELERHWALLSKEQFAQSPAEINAYLKELRDGSPTNELGTTKELKQLGRVCAIEQFGMIEHEGRKTILAELHARPFLPFQAPRRMYHFAFATSDDEARNDRKAFVDLCARSGVAKPPEGAKFHHVELADWDLRWEQHTEFTTYTWSTTLDAAEPFMHPDPLGAQEIAFLAPGPLVVATHLALIDGGPSHESLGALFNSQSLCIVGAAKGAAQVLTDFTVDPHGFTRLLIRSDKLGETRAGRLVQRVLEIETYRTLALLGLPEGRRAGPVLERMEREISEINQALSEARDQRTSQDLLKRLSDLLAGSEALSTQTAFRFGASRAYHAIVKNRLDLIQEAKAGSYTTISAFFSARLDPAIETCNAIETRRARLSNQVVRAIDLMRTGITFELEQQNRDLLQDMNRRARLQMRLQGIVQGLSIAALAYYLSGLTVYLAKGMKDAGWLPHDMTADMFVALAVPIAIFASWSFMERVRRLSMKAREEEKVN